MGVPKVFKSNKFFRWVSERYPLISEVVEEKRIPEFDNLYLDMNGIIHKCSHPSDDPTYRITESQIFSSIFSYIDYIFATIKPQKVFMMAVDGVAPRAKMNQQRARRFRAAMDAKLNAEKALSQGIDLPPEPAFDSNCITPGTPFMHKLQIQLQYYISRKITEDSKWKNISVIFSGHDVPGEGEHKIIDFIRKVKSAEDYNPNTRHCLYGLDADLMMLGLLSHEPHCSLLREEVVFGPQRKSAVSNEPQKFYLLHLSLFREYLYYEFQNIEGKLPFDFNFERVLDDFVLMTFFVGNDFLPHLPELNINEGALETLFLIYRELLPKLGGYLQEDGILNVLRCKTFFAELSKLELKKFDSFNGNAVVKPKTSRPNISMSKAQSIIYSRIRDYITTLPCIEDFLTFNWSNLSEIDRKFILKLISSLGLDHDLNTEDQDDTLLVISRNPDEESDEESEIARNRILIKYDKAAELFNPVDDPVDDVNNEQFLTWKKNYYSEKLEFGVNDEESINNLVYQYFEGLQWVLLYYYKGVQSWEWFFPYHYAPKITDLQLINDTAQFSFQMSEPFRPFEQLMAVLPPLSKQHVPPCFQDLMTDSLSPIIDFYPSKFDLDMNGKKNSWEAVVKIPFINSKRLFEAIQARENQLSPSERIRNAVGVAKLFEHSIQSFHYKSPSPSEFQDIANCHCKGTEFKFDVSIMKPVNRLCEGARIGNDVLPGFPSLYRLPHTAEIKRSRVQIFSKPSNNASVILTIRNQYDNLSSEEIARKLLKHHVFVNYPFLIEAKVVSVQDENFVYKGVGKSKKLVKTPLDIESQRIFAKSCEVAGLKYACKGIEIGPVDMTVTVEVLSEMVLLNDGSFVKKFVPFSEFDFPVQVIISGQYHDPRFRNIPCPPIAEEFPIKSPVIFLAPKLYGAVAEVIGYNNDTPAKLTVKVKRCTDPKFQKEPLELQEMIEAGTEKRSNIFGWKLAKILKLPAISLSRLTSSILVEVSDNGPKLNLGLNLKYDYRKLKIFGYSEYNNNQWEYTPKAVELIQSYLKKFPAIFKMLKKPDSNYTISNLFSDVSDVDDKISEIKQWLKDNGVKDFIPVPIDAVTLPISTISNISEFMMKYLEEKKNSEEEEILINNVPRSHVLKPDHAIFRISDQNFEPGNRVLFTLNHGIVPLGTRGTVIGIVSNILEIICDVKILCGTNLEGRCPEGHGISCEKFGLLNLTKIYPPIAAKAPRLESAAKEKQEQPKTSPADKWKSKNVAVKQPPVFNPAEPPLKVPENFSNSTSNFGTGYAVPGAYPNMAQPGFNYPIPIPPNPYIPTSSLPPYGYIPQVPIPHTSVYSSQENAVLSANLNNMLHIGDSEVSPKFLELLESKREEDNAKSARQQDFGQNPRRRNNGGPNQKNNSRRNQKFN